MVKYWCSCGSVSGAAGPLTVECLVGLIWAGYGPTEVQSVSCTGPGRTLHLSRLHADGCTTAAGSPDQVAGGRTHSQGYAQFGCDARWAAADQPAGKREREPAYCRKGPNTPVFCG